ncbi:MAG: HAMP domain-containing protein [Endomicrobiales bacterium]
MLRKTYIVNPRLQFKYLVIALIVVCVTGIAMYYTFWSSLIRSAGLEQLSSGEWRALERGYQTSFLWVILLLAAAVALESIFLFHRIIGPIFVFNRALKKLSGGDLNAAVHFRRRDELKDMAATITALITNLRASVTTDRRKIEEIKRKLDQGDLTGAKADLSGLTQWFKTE